MADLYPDHPSYHHDRPHQPPAYPHINTQDAVAYAQQHPEQSQPSSNTSSPESGSPHQTTPKSAGGADNGPANGNARQEGKQQATFLTKLYALLERPENHHMIRWDPQGEHIIVEKPEQLAIHVLPSVYRQSRFASFSRQLNIYGFMRKVNLRNVDPAIDDPDASTWSHPTLNRHSTPETVANFKRRVPPRIPKKKRAEDAAAAAAAQSLSPRSGGGLAPMQTMGRARAFTAPGGSFTPLSSGSAVGWGASYPNARGQIPPLEVPGGHQGHAMHPQSGMFQHGGYGPPPPHSSHHPMSPQEDAPMYPGPYMQQSRGDMMSPTSSYGPGPYHGMQDPQWQFQHGPPGHSNTGLNNLLNPTNTGNGQYGRPSLNTYGGGSFPGGGPIHSPSSPSDSRPNTGYSVSSATSVGYDDKPGVPHFGHDHSRPTSSHHYASGRQLSPGPGSRPGSSHNPAFQPPNSLSIRRARRHSQAHSPYPSPYDGPHGPDGRPSTSPPDNQDPHQLSRVRSMVQLPSHPPGSAGGDFAHGPQGGYSSSHGDFAYHPSGPMHGGDAMDVYSHSVRPSTAASSMSTASHQSSSAATPPVTGGGEKDINRLLNR